MTLPLTPEILQAGYDLLRLTEPFCRWNLMDGEDIVFKVVKRTDCSARYVCDGKRHFIEISTRYNRHTDTILSSIAHEMIHLYQNQSGMKCGKAEHDAAFHKFAEQVCKIHGWDPGQFL